MSTFQYQIGTGGHKAPNENIFAKIRTPLSNTDTFYIVERPCAEAQPYHCFTATTDMRDWIGNVTKLWTEDDGRTFCSVKGVYRGKQGEYTKIRVIDSAIQKVGQRVMVTEHLDVSGKLEFIASTKRLISVTESEMNFINIGWIVEGQFHHMRVDPYTGEAKEFFVKQG